MSKKPDIIAMLLDGNSPVVIAATLRVSVAYVRNLKRDIRGVRS